MVLLALSVDGKDFGIKLNLAILAPKGVKPSLEIFARKIRG